MCKHGTDEIVNVKITAERSHTGNAYYRDMPIDKCIAPIVRALQDGGIDMNGSCCGHGKCEGGIILADGRELIILEAEDAENYRCGSSMPDTTIQNWIRSLPRDYERWPEGAERKHQDVAIMWRIRWLCNWLRTCWKFRCIAPWCTGCISHRKLTAAEIAWGQEIAREYGLMIPPIPSCPDCGGELIHGGMGVPIYDCSQCEEMWLVRDGVITQRVTEGCPAQKAFHGLT